jgi:hypothetical protein
MSVEFEEDTFTPKRDESMVKSGGMAGWLVRHNFAKDESGANKILIILIILCFVLAAYFAFFR